MPKKQKGSSILTVEKLPDTFCPNSPSEWRAWLEQHHVERDSIWLVYYKKRSGRPSLIWSEAVDEALCFGWIDSTAKAIDEERYQQYFCKRKPSSVWSKINKDKVERLVADGKMAAAGQASIELAKANGTWTSLDEVEQYIVPKDLEKALKFAKGAKAYFEGLSPSTRKAMLQWVSLAKRAETRQKRIAEIAALASARMKPRQF